MIVFSTAWTRVGVILLFITRLLQAFPPCTNKDLASSYSAEGAVYDREYAIKQIYRSKGNTDHKAQFKEDITLYENYFFGKKNGVIMESGALDGDLYSTSYMFEKHFDWKAIHIGALEQLYTLHDLINLLHVA